MQNNISLIPCVNPLIIKATQYYSLNDDDRFYVYGFNYNDEFVYIGSTRKIKSRLTTWLTGNCRYHKLIPFIKEKRDLIYIHLFELGNNYKDIESGLIFSLQPRFNDAGKKGVAYRMKHGIKVEAN